MSPRIAVAFLWLAVSGPAVCPLASHLRVPPAAIPKAAWWRRLLDDFQES